MKGFWVGLNIQKTKNKLLTELLSQPLHFHSDFSSPRSNYRVVEKYMIYTFISNFSVALQNLARFAPVIIQLYDNGTSKNNYQTFI